MSYEGIIDFFKKQAPQKSEQSQSDQFTEEASSDKKLVNNSVDLPNDGSLNVDKSI